MRAEMGRNWRNEMTVKRKLRFALVLKRKLKLIFHDNLKNKNPLYFQSIWRTLR